MHNKMLWILIIAAIYASFTIHWTVKQNNFIGSLEEDLRDTENTWRDTFFIRSMQVLLFILGAVFCPIFIVGRSISKQRRRRAKEKAALAALEKEKRIAEWKKNNRPELVYNTVNGITRVMREQDFRREQEAILRRIMDGLMREGDIVPIPLGLPSFIFCHASGQDNVPDQYKAGWLSDFEDLKGFATVCKSHDLFVPFVSEKTYSFKEQAMIFPVPFSRHASPAQRVETARNSLLHVTVPNAILQ